MPELPEVETTRRGLLPHLVGRRVRAVVVRQPQLRWPIAAELVAQLPGQRIEAVERRAKYLLVHTRVGSALLHLGMSGSLRVLPERTPAGPHDHVDWRLDDHRLLRLTDPRRFGCELWQAPGTVHELLRGLGPEPLGEDFDGDVLWLRSRGRRSAVKVFIMDQAVVVGVGNIYASEALFVAGIAPRRPAGQVSRERYLALADAHFENDRYWEWCDKHLAHLPEAVHDWFAGPDFDRILRETVRATFPPHEHDTFIAHYRGLIQAWVRDNAVAS